MAKPKGFSTMCWLGIALNILAIIYSIFVVTWQGIFYHSLKILPSLISLDVIQSDLEMLSETILCVTAIFQLFCLFQMLRERRNYIDKMLYTFGIEILVTLKVLQYSNLDLATNVMTIIIITIAYGIPTIYFCRQPVYSYFEK